MSPVQCIQYVGVFNAYQWMYLIYSISWYQATVNIKDHAVQTNAKQYSPNPAVFVMGA